MASLHQETYISCTSLRDEGGESDETEKDRKIVGRGQGVVIVVLANQVC